MKLEEFAPNPHAHKYLIPLPFAAYQARLWDSGRKWLWPPSPLKISEPIDKMGVHVLPLTKRGQQQTFTPHFSKGKWEHLRCLKWCKKQLKSIGFTFDFGKRKSYFVDFSGDVLVDFHGFQINKLQLKKTRCRSIGFRILSKINIRCPGVFSHRDTRVSRRYMGCLVLENGKTRDRKPPNALMTTCFGMLGNWTPRRNPKMRV